MKRNWIGPLGLLVIVVLAMAVLRSQFGGAAETPQAFADHTPLPVAMERAEQTGRPVLALVTADWCGPCQTLKRNGLADRTVAEWIETNAVAAYVDATNPDDPAAQQAQRLLAIEAYPTLILLQDGREVSRRVGVLSATALIDWLRADGARVSPMDG